MERHPPSLLENSREAQPLQHGKTSLTAGVRIMIDSIFDPKGSQTEHSGSPFTWPRAENNSRMPEDQVDGKVSEQEAAEIEGLARPDDAALDPDPALENIADAVKELNPDYAGDTIWERKDDEV